jgi:hypothetical protein
MLCMVSPAGSAFGITGSGPATGGCFEQRPFAESAAFAGHKWGPPHSPSFDGLWGGGGGRRANTAFTLPWEKGCAAGAALLKGALTTMRATGDPDR